MSWNTALARVDGYDAISEASTADLAKHPDRVNLGVLVIEDEAPDFITLERSLSSISSYDIRAAHATCSADAIELLRSYKFDIAFVDYRLPGENGADIIRSITPLLNGCVPILLTGDTSDLAQREALISGAQHCLLKEDVSPRTIETTIRSVIHRAYWR